MHEDQEEAVKNINFERKYFTIIPNYVGQKCNSKELSVYFHIKAAAGENGVCWFSRGTIMKKTGLGKDAVASAINNLIKYNFIRFIGKRAVPTKGGPQEVNCYSIVDVWEENVKAKGGSESATPSIKGGVQIRSKGGSESASNKITKIKTINAETSSALLWDLETELQKLERTENSAMDIIATFIRKKNVVVTNKKQLSMVIKRYVRVANQLSGAYTNAQIFDAAKKIIKDNQTRKFKGQEEIDWTLETVFKMLTK